MPHMPQAVDHGNIYHGVYYGDMPQQSAALLGPVTKNTLQLLQDKPDMQLHVAW